MLHAFMLLLCSKVCRHNSQRPTESLPPEVTVAVDDTTSVSLSWVSMLYRFIILLASQTKVLYFVSVSCYACISVTVWVIQGLPTYANMWLAMRGVVFPVHLVSYLFSIDIPDTCKLSQNTDTILLVRILYHFLQSLVQGLKVSFSYYSERECAVCKWAATRPGPLPPSQVSRLV